MAGWRSETTRYGAGAIRVLVRTLIQNETRKLPFGTGDGQAHPNPQNKQSGDKATDRLTREALTSDVTQSTVFI